MTTTARRLALLACAVPALVFAAPAAAAADSAFLQQDTSATRKGATMTFVRAVAADDGSVSYVRVTYTAGPKGAAVTSTASAAR
jgi:hypothetical protein